MSYLARRLGFYLLAAWASLTMTFVIPRMMPGDPTTTLFARFKGKLGPEALEALREALGFTEAPLWRQYLEYLGNVAQGEFGISIKFYPTPVSEVIAHGLMWTLFLTGMAVMFSFVLGSLLGVVVAWKRGGRLDTVVPPALVFLGSFPYFWLSMALLFLFGFSLGWFPIRHAHAPHLEPAFDFRFLGSAFRHAILPAFTIILASVGAWTLDMRNTMMGVLDQDYIKLARAKGLSSRRIMFRYAARNALLPNITGFGMALGFVLSGSILTEVVFAYPGQGYLLLQAVQSQDYPLLQGLFLTITIAVLGANWLVDVAYTWLDPRTRAN